MLNSCKNKKKITGWIILTGLELMILFSYYPAFLKIVLCFLCTALLLVIIFKQEKLQFWVMSFAALFIGMNAVIMILSYYPFWYQNSAQMNMQTGLATTQSCYFTGTYNSEIILPALLKGKEVYVEEGNCYAQLIGFFADSTKEMEEFRYLNFENMKDEYLYMGKTNMVALDFLLDQETFDTISQLQEGKKRPGIYISSSEVAKSASLVILSDEEYNMYILTSEEAGE